MRCRLLKFLVYRKGSRKGSLLNHKDTEAQRNTNFTQRAQRSGRKEGKACSIKLLPVKYRHLLRTVFYQFQNFNYGTGIIQNVPY